VGVAPLVRSLPEFPAPGHPDFDRWYLTGFDDRLLARGAPALGERDPRYASDRAALEAVLASPDLAIVPVWFLQTGGGPPEGVAEIGDTIVMRDPASGRRRDLRVVGTVEADWALAGVMVSARTARDVLGAGAVQSRSMVAVAPGTDPDRLAQDLTGRLASNGADAESVEAVVDRALASNRSFMALSQGYVALGLVVGIGGLGVVMVRAVRERRRQIGMLRAMGLPAITVRRAFVIESAFVAARGLVIGGGLAIVSCWLLVTQTDSVGTDVAFSVPWVTIGALLAAALVASLAATALPAARASRISPAVALRVSD
jgi:putative ABC transport system permease protein